MASDSDLSLHLHSLPPPRMPNSLKVETLSERQKGFCDDELIAITNNNTMFKQQAHCLVKRRQPELWAQVLVGCQLIDQVLLPLYIRCYWLIISSDYRDRPSWIYGSWRCFGYSQNFSSSWSPNRTHRVIGEDHYRAVAIQQKQESEKTALINCHPLWQRENGWVYQ